MLRREKEMKKKLKIGDRFSRSGQPDRTSDASPRIMIAGGDGDQRGGVAGEEADQRKADV
jgi:hypothetical protein